LAFHILCFIILFLFGTDNLERLDANFASRDLVSAVDFTFKSLKLWISELLVSVDCSDPETEAIAEELASTSGTSALNKWSGSEIFEATTWTGHILSATVSTFRGVSEEGVTHPHGVVTGWAIWDLSSLRVDSDDIGWSFTYVTSRDVLSNVLDIDGHHWHGSTSSQPVGFGVSTRVSADFVVIAEGGWHGIEFLSARASGA
jgi:hypothetical protein